MRISTSDDVGKLLDEAETRLKAIYEDREYDHYQFRGKWLRDSSGYTQLEDSQNKVPELVRYDVEGGERSILIRESELATEQLHIRQYTQSPTEHQFLLQGVSRQGEEEERGYWLFDCETRNLKKVDAGIDWLDLEHAFSPGGGRIIFSKDGDLCVFDFASNRSVRLTTDSDADAIGNGRASWSPDGEHVLYVQSDSSEVPERPHILPTDPTYPKVEMRRFARVGTAITTFRVGVVSSHGGETRWLDLPRPAGTFHVKTAKWAGNSTKVLVELQSRGRDARELLLLNIDTCNAITIYEETDEAWVDSCGGRNSGLAWVQGGEACVILSEKDGWRHAYVVSRDGEKQSLLTPDASDIVERGPVDEENGWFYYYASPDNATQRYLYRIQLDGEGDAERVSPSSQRGTHHYIFSPDCTLAVHSYSGFDTPPTVDLIRLSDHQVQRVIHSGDEYREQVAPLIQGETEHLQLDIGDGVVLDARMIKPRDFDESKKYPVFVYVYSEPAAQTVLDQWSVQRNHTMFHRMIADLGYLVVTIDSRGTPAPKGAAWRRSVFGSLGPLSTEEQAAGLKELARMRPYADSSRVGIWGWSGGGTNTLNALFRKPDDYHVGIAVAPKPQPDLYNAWFQEIFMRTPEENPDGYREAAAINFAEGLRGDLLIIHGTGETNTHLQITEGLVDKLIALGKRFEYMAYPNRDHGLHEGEGTAVHLRLLITRYLIEHLPRGPR